MNLDLDGEEWLDKAMDSILRSKEWKVLARQIYNNVGNKLEQNHVRFLSDLSEDERMMLVDEIEKSLDQEYVYMSFQKLLSDTVSNSITEEVKSELETNPGSMTRTELVVSKASSGTVKLLKEMPGNRATLKLLMNQELPTTLRHHVWQIYLASGTKVKTEYEKRANSRRTNTVSVHDSEITEACQSVVDSEFPEFPEGGSAVMSMKTALSYFHATTGQREDPMIYLTIPLVYVLGADFYMVSTIVEALSCGNFSFHNSSFPSLKRVKKNPSMFSSGETATTIP